MWCVVHVYGFTVESYSRQVIDYRRVMVLRRGGTYSRVLLTPSRGGGVLQLRGNLVHGEYSRITSSKARRGGVPQLRGPTARGKISAAGETPEPTLGGRRPVLYGPATAHPPGLGLSSPQPDPNRLANWGAS